MYQYPNYLMHYGIPGTKWGVRKKDYSSTSVRAAMARRQNDKVDAGFKNWNDNSKKKANAIDLGKEMNTNRMAYESNRNKKTKAAYKSSKKAYKKALRKNTTYRKGAIRGEVGKDASRKYLSAAKKVKKQLDADPNNKQLKRQYSDLMSKHDLKRGKASKEAYEAINYMMTNKSDAARKLNKEYDKALIKSGYDAIVDYNDTKLSGFNTKDSLIIINKGKLTVEKYDELKI